MKNIRICTPVTGKTLEEFLSNLEKIQKISDFIELRTDYIQDLELEDLETLRKKTIKPAIFTYRRKSEGGVNDIPEKERVTIIKKALELKFEYIDIDFTALRDYRFTIPRETKLIASYHNFERTNQFPTLCRYIDEIDLANVDIIKIATMVNSEEDNKILFRLLVDCPTKKDMIVIGMGPLGAITRIVTPMLGGFLTYASTKYSHSAPGQIDLDELKVSYERYSRFSTKK